MHLKNTHLMIAGPLSVAAYVNVDCIDIDLVELNFCPPARPRYLPLIRG